MTEERSVRTTLSMNASNYISTVRQAAEETKKIAIAAIEVRTRVGEIGTATGELSAKFRGLASSGGFTELSRELGKVRDAVRGLSGLTAISTLARDLRDLGSVGGSLTVSTEAIRKMANAMAAISRATTNPAALRDFASAMHNLRSIGGSASADEIVRLSAGIRRLVRDANSVPALRALATALRDLGAAGGALAGLGNVGNSLRGMQSQIDQLQRSIARLRAGGGSGSGSGSSGGMFGSILGGNLVSNALQNSVYALGGALKSTFKQTADYETEIQTFGAVLKATPAQLQQVSAKALALGADFTIAGASASDAAVTMTELGKGGLSIQGSMDAAKGSLQLASAGAVSFTSAAEIMTSALASFQLNANQAGTVTDVLANTANAARGNIADFAEGIKYAGTVSHQAGYSLQTTSAVLAVFAQNGLTGSVGGTVFKEMILKLENASGKAKVAVKALGISTYDTNGNFITATKLADQLAAAKKRMSKEDFNAATATVFGARAIQGASIFAASGGKAIESMSQKIQDGAGAAAFSAARMKGLGGAFANMQNQVQTAQVVLGEKFSPALQSVMNKVSAAIPIVTGFLTGSALGGGVSRIGGWFDPLISGASALVAKVMPYVQSFLTSMGHAFQSVIGFIKPVADSLGTFFHQISNNGTVGIFGSALAGLGKGFEGLLNFLKPIGGWIGETIRWIGSLGPVVDTALIAMTALKVLPIGAFFTSIAQKAALATYAMGTTGIAGAASTALGGLSRFAGVLAGPWGLAIGGGLAALYAWFGHSNDAAAATTDFSSALDTNTGKLAANGATDIATKVKDAESAYVAAGGAMGDYTAAVSGNIAAQQRVQAQFTATEFKAISGSNAWQHYGKVFSALGITTQDVANAYAKGGDAVGTLEQRVLTSTDAMNKAGFGVTDIRNAFEGFGSAVDTQSKQLATYNQYISEFAGQQTTATSVATNAAAAQKLLGGATKKTAAEQLNAWNHLPKYIQLGQDLDKATRLSAVGSTAAATAMKSVASEAAAMQAPVASATDIFKNWAEHVAGITKVNIDSSGFITFETQTSQAFAKFKTDSTAAQDSADLFWFHVAGPASTAQQQIYATAAAMRAIAAAGRDSGSNADAVTSAQNALKTAQNKKTGGTDGYTSAQKVLDVAAAYRTLQAAQDIAAGSAAALYNAEVAGAQLSIKSVEDAYKKTAATKGYTAGIKAATDEMGRQRQAFIDNYVAGQQSSMSDAEKATTLGAITTQAKKAADAMGLIPSKVATTITLDGSALIARAAEIKMKADAAAKARILKFTADTKDAIRSVDQYGSFLNKMPKSLLTKFNADIATAKANGQNLYRVYNATTGQWVAQFLTPTAAAAKQKAGDLVREYDRNRGTWTANLVAVNLASAQIDAVAASLAAIKDKTVTLTVNAQGQSVTVQSNGSFTTGAGKKGFATGGMISGPGTGTSDSILIRASHGEGINTADAMSKAPNRKAMEFMNAGGTIPGFAVGGLVGSHTNLNLLGAGNINQTLSSLTALYANVDRSVTSANAATAAAAAVAAAIPKANGGGTEQWRALALSVAAAKGENAASVQVMLNQMSRESSGNPAAINLTDSNALAGHPSVGLLQFIPSTFASYADPGFNSNIYDPASQMHAWYNYINAVYGGYVKFGQRGYGAYANGGIVSGPGSGRSDSILARVSNGEGINTASAMSVPANRNAMHYMNAGGTIPGFAAGGFVGGDKFGLSGRTAVSPGTAESAVVQALSSITATLSALHATVDTMRQKAADTASNLATALAAQINNPKGPAAALAAARAAQLNNEKSGVQSIAAAQKVQATETAKTTARQRAIDASRVVSAQQSLERNKANDAARIASAQRALDKVQATDAVNVAKATREHDAAVKNAQAYQATSVAADRMERALTAVNRLQVAYGAKLDALNVKLTDAQSNLSTLQGNRASAASSVASTVSGFDGGLTGHPDTRNTFATILQGQQYDAAQAKKFSDQLAVLKKKGLSAENINQIAAAGIDGGGVTATALASATPAQLKQLNAVTKSIGGYGAAAGNTAAGATFDAGIAAAQGFVKGWESQISAIQKAMDHGAKVAVTALTNALQIKSPSRVMHVLGQHTATGYANGIASGYGKVATAMAGMANMPAAPYLHSGINRGGSQQIDVQVYLDGQRIDDRVQLKINGVYRELASSARKVGGQR